jgi:hypothetical protein
MRLTRFLSGPMRTMTLPTLIGGAILAIFLGASNAYADTVDITFTGTLNAGAASFPWGYANDNGAATNIVGDTFIANFQFNTGQGTFTPSGTGGSLSGAGSATAIGSVTIPAIGQTFVAYDGYLASYGRQDNAISVIFYEDASASAGIVLEASLPSGQTWGSALTDPIPSDTPVVSEGEAIVIQPPGQYYDLVAFAVPTTVSVTPVPEPAAFPLLGATLLALAGSMLVARKRRLRVPDMQINMSPRLGVTVTPRQEKLFDD